MSPIGLLDMLRFKNMKVQRDKIIESTPLTALVENYASNQNAAAKRAWKGRCENVYPSPN